MDGGAGSGPTPAACRLTSKVSSGACKSKEPPKPTSEAGQLMDNAPNMCATFVLAQILKCDEIMARGELRKAYEHLQAENKNRNMSYLGTPDEGLYHFDVLRQALKNHHKETSRLGGANLS